MSMTAHMSHSCKIVRNFVEAEDKFGGPGKNWSSEIYSGCCRLVEKQQRVYTDDRSEYAVITVYKLFLPALANVEERDVIRLIKIDNQVLENAFTVKSILRRRSKSVKFISIDLERVA